MAPLKDPETLAAYKGVLSNYDTSECVVFKPQARDFVRLELGCTPVEVSEAMFLYVESPDGVIDAQEEKLELWRKRHPIRYDIRFPFQSAELYAETTLDIHPRDPYYSTITVVKLKYRDEKLNQACAVQT